MKRRDFFKWLAAATGAVYLEPSRALAGRADGNVIDREVEHHLLLGTGNLHLISFSVVPGQDTVLYIEASDGDTFQICGLRAMVKPREVLLTEIRTPRFLPLSDGFDDPLDPHGAVDMAFFATDDTYCPLDGGVVVGDRMTMLRMRTFDDIVEPVSVGLIVVGNHMTGQVKLCDAWAKAFDMAFAHGYLVTP